jgi:hypothetical protein
MGGRRGHKSDRQGQEELEERARRAKPRCSGQECEGDWFRTKSWAEIRGVWARLLPVVTGKRGPARNQTLENTHSATTQKYYAPSA